MATEWITAIDKRPCDRNLKDVDVISQRLRRVEQLNRLPSAVLQQLALYGYYEDLEEDITLFRQGDLGLNWYAVLGGQLEVRQEQPSRDSKEKTSVTLCTLGVGATFGESVLNDSPRESTVVTRSTCELLRIQRKDFKLIWEKNKEFMGDIVANSKKKNGLGPAALAKSSSSPPQSPPLSPTRRPQSPDNPSPCGPITDSPSPQMAWVGWTLHTLLLADSSSSVLRDHRSSNSNCVYQRCASGRELIDWIMSLSPSIHTRHQAIGMWQVLLEEGVIFHVTGEHPFRDKALLYWFWQDKEGPASLPSQEQVVWAEDQLNASLGALIQKGPDALMRMMLRKPSHERTPDDLETIYEELLHIKALSHLSHTVKRELASVIVFEAHPHAGTVLFNQGDEGRSWYIILRGSVDVVIHGKGTVTTLQEGDDFGKLALINDAPRAATIVLREDNCHFLRVDKENFNRILRDVEANTVRLKEHGKDVLVLEKISAPHSAICSHFKYTVMAGTPQKMLEHLLETRLDGRGGGGGVGGRDSLPSSTTDPLLEDFLLTHIIFMPTHQLVTELVRQYPLQFYLLHCKDIQGK